MIPTTAPSSALAMQSLPVGTQPPILDDARMTQTQFFSPNAMQQSPLDAASLGFRRVSLLPRGDTPYSIVVDFYDRNDPTRGGVGVLTGGINLVLEAITHEGARAVLAGDTIDIAADNAVIWTENPTKLIGTATYVESDRIDLELYLEGNIVFRDGPRVIYADRMYYDVKHQIGYITNGHLIMPIGDISGLEGYVRVRADTLRQLGDGMFTARNTMLTTSMLGEPAYSLRSQTLRFNQQGTSPFDVHARPRQMIVAENNYVAIRNMPVFYWPWMATDVQNPTFYLRSLSYGSSGRDGHRIRSVWDPFQIFNIRRPDGVDGDIYLGWIEKRGINYGVNFRYDLPRANPVTLPFAQIPGNTS